jgi:6-phosphofructokinase 1
MRAVLAHSGGPTAVINASLVGLVVEARRHPAITSLDGAQFGIEGLLNGDFADLFALSPGRLNAIGQATSSALGTSRRAVMQTDIERVLDVCRSRDVRWLFYTGGNGSMETARRIADAARSTRLALSVIGVPKTIDNDLLETDHTPGFPSAARFFAAAARDIGADNRALRNQVQILEVLGRNTGWITAATTMARRRPTDPPHLVYLPERPLPLSRFLDDVQRVFDRLSCCTVTVCEGQLDDRGEPFGADVRMSSRGPLATNLAHRLALVVTERLGIKARGEKPGLLGRVSTELRSEVDWDEARRVGEAAVRAAMAGESGVMVALRRGPGSAYFSSTELVPLDRVAGTERRFPAEWINESGHDVHPDFTAWAAPLVGPLATASWLS